MDAHDKISFCLHELQTEDPVKYMQACQTLMDNSNSLVFREIISHKIEDVTKLLIKKSEISNQETLLGFYLHDESKESSDFVSLEENSLLHDIQASNKNIRYYSSNLLLHLAVRFDSYFLKIFIPLLWKSCFLGNTWRKREVGIYLFNKVELIIFDNDFSLFHIIARLIDFLNFPEIEIKLPACLTLINYTKHCVNYNESQFFKPMLQNVLPFLLDTNNTIQEQGCLAILKLDEFFGDRLSYFENIINLYVRKAYRLRPIHNSTFLAKVQALVRKYQRLNSLK